MCYIGELGNDDKEASYCPENTAKLEVQEQAMNSNVYQLFWYKKHVNTRDKVEKQNRETKCICNYMQHATITGHGRDGLIVTVGYTQLTTANEILLSWNPNETAISMEE